MPGFEWLGPEEQRAVNEVMERKVLFRYEFAKERQGVWKVREFEEALARFTGATHAQAVTSGTAALKVALAALGVGPGDEVITQGFTFVATWETILETGAKPVFCEIDESLCLDPADLEGKITDRTACIVPVHMMGAPARIAEIMAVADRHGIPVLEDTAQALGCTLTGRHVGTFGALGTFSFDSVKTVTTGEGGGIITSDEELYLNASEYHDHGHDHKPGDAATRGAASSQQLPHDGVAGRPGLRAAQEAPAMLATQRRLKNELKEALARIPGISFRRLEDPAGDSATFLAWFMPSPADAQRLAQLLAKEGAARSIGGSTPGTPTTTGSISTAARAWPSAAGLSCGRAARRPATGPTPCPAAGRSWTAACPGRSCSPGTRPGCSRWSRPSTPPWPPGRARGG